MAAPADVEPNEVDMQDGPSLSGATTAIITPKEQAQETADKPMTGIHDDAAGIQTGHVDKLPARRATRAATPAGAKLSEVAEPKVVGKRRKEKGMDTKHHVAAVDAGQLGIKGGDDDGAST